MSEAVGARPPEGGKPDARGATQQEEAASRFPTGATLPPGPRDAGDEPALLDDAPHPHGHPRGLERVEEVLDAAAHRVLAPAEAPDKPQWFLPLVKLFVPLLLMGVGLALLPLLFPSHVPEIYLFLSHYFLVPGGLETAIPVGLGVLGLQAVVLVGLVIYVTMAGTLFMVWNLEHLDRVPWLGRRVRRLEQKAERAYRKRPWLERSAFWGVSLFVLLPLNGTGAVPGAIIGKFLGLHKALTWLAVVVGSTVRVTAWTLLSVGALRIFF